MLQYLLQTILFQLIFLLVYELMLKKETFFSHNRWYLLLTSSLALLLPLINIEGLSEIIPKDSLVLLPEVAVGQPAGPGVMAEGSSAASSESSALKYWYLFYAFGALLSLLLFIKKYMVLRHLFRHRILSRTSGLRIIEVADSNLACTFFSTIFLGDQLSVEERKQILSHEKVHVVEKHSYDLVYFEILRIVFWFNPLIYIYQQKIAALHEFIADAGVVKTLEKRTYYQQLLNTAFNTEDISFINQFFNHSLIKKRIVMLQKTQSRSIAKLKFLLLFPVVFLMLSVVSFAQETGTEEDTKLVIKVGQVENQTNEEQEKVAKALGGLERGELYQEVVISDGTNKIYYTKNENNGKIIKSSVTRTSVEMEPVVGDVPFMLIEEAPIYPGCEGITDNNAAKACLVEKLTSHVNRNFNTGIAKEQGLTGMLKVYVLFKIKKDGKVDFQQARGPIPELEAEAERVINSLPQMKPGKHRGEAVAVLYSLPIKINIPTEKGSTE